MANSWLKLYHEMLNDPKMGTMTDHLYRRTIEIFLLAGQEGRNGLLPPLTQIAWALRTTVNDATLCLQELAELGIITKLPDGTYIVTHFTERQDTNLSDAERQQRRRDKSKSSRELSDARHADDVTTVTQTDTQTVTQQSRTLSDGETEIVTLDKDKDKDIDKEEDKELINNKELIKNSLVNKTAFNARAEKPAKKAEPEKIAYGSQHNVMLTPMEYAKLCEQFPDADAKIEAMSLYFESHGNAWKYKSHYATALNWARMAAEREKGKKPPQQTGKSFAEIAADYEHQEKEPDPVWDIIDL